MPQPHIFKVIKLVEADEGTYEEQNNVQTLGMGISPSEAMEKLLTLEVSEKERQKMMQVVFEKAGWKKDLFSAIAPTRDFFLGNHDVFDEYQIQGDYEDAIILAKLHESFTGYSLILFNFAIAHSALTRSRAGFQQRNMRSYYGHSATRDETPQPRGGFNINPLSSRK